MVFWIRGWLLSPAVWSSSSGSTHYSHAFLEKKYQKAVCLVTFWLLRIPFQPQSSPSFQTLGLECIIAARCLQRNYSLIDLLYSRMTRVLAVRQGQRSAITPRIAGSSLIRILGKSLLSRGTGLQLPVCLSRWLFAWKPGLFSRHNIPRCHLTSCFLIKDITTILKWKKLFSCAFHINFKQNLYIASIKILHLFSFIQLRF